MYNVKPTKLIALRILSGSISVLGIAQAQVAGSTTELNEVVALGWSAKKNLLGKTVYNENGEQVGNIQDLIISADRKVSYVIVGAGGFIGIGRHDVAIPVLQIKAEGGRFVLPGATKVIVKAMPKFDYANDIARRNQFVAMAENDIELAKVKIIELQKRSVTAVADAKVKLDAQIVALQQDLKIAEDILAEMKRVGVSRWKEFESNVSVAVKRLQQSVNRAFN